LIDLLENQVPDVKNYIEDTLAQDKDSSDCPPYENLLSVIEFLITILP